MKPLSDIEIAQKTELIPIVEIAEKLNINEDDLELVREVQSETSTGFDR